MDNAILTKIFYYVCYTAGIPLSNYQNILNFTCTFYFTIQISLSHPAVNASYTGDIHSIVLYYSVSPPLVKETIFNKLL